MTTIQASVNLDPDETVLLEMEPHQVGCAEALILAFLGVLLLFIPTVLAFVYWRWQKRRHRDSKCVVTNKRIVVQNWGEPGRLLDLRYDAINGIHPEPFAGVRFGSVVITLADGSRIKLNYLEGVVHFATVAQRAMEAYKGRF